MMHFVEEILDVQPYRLTLKFNTGEIRCVNLEATLHAKATLPESAYRRLLDPVLFRQVRLDRQSRTICWEGLARQIQTDGTEQPAPLDFCPDALYALGTPLAESESREQVSA
jgi:hypothetical protein